MGKPAQLDEASKLEKVSELRRQIIDSRSLDADGQVDSNFVVDEACCDRYLRARNFNLSAARQMLEETIAWRQSYFPLDRDIITREANGKTFVSPHCDDSGRVILVMRNKLENTKDHHGNVMHLVYQMERAVLATSETAHEKWNLLIDFDGYSMFNAPPMKTSKATLYTMQSHYPERLHKAYLISAPWLFNAVFKAISPFIDPVTRDKIVFVNKPQHLFNFGFPRSSIETCLGGDSRYVFDKSAYLAAETTIFPASSDDHSTSCAPLQEL